MVSDGEISWVLGGQPDPEAVVTWLIDAANSAGGVDNITVIVVSAEAAEQQDSDGWQKEHGVDHADFLDALLDPDDALHEVARRAVEGDSA
jgi:serine/threonine protein phosphatase PrpC